jgi:hypothetical protein
MTISLPAVDKLTTRMRVERPSKKCASTTGHQD